MLGTIYILSKTSHRVIYWRLCVNNLVKGEVVV